MDLSVHITYRNSKRQPIGDEFFSFDDYTSMVGNDVLRLLTDFEDIIYTALDGSQKEDWPDEVWTKYARVKHKVLDIAGAIRR